MMISECEEFCFYCFKSVMVRQLSAVVVTTLDYYTKTYDIKELCGKLKEKNNSKTYTNGISLAQFIWPQYLATIVV